MLDQPIQERLGEGPAYPLVRDVGYAFRIRRQPTTRTTKVVAAQVR
jgi:hypothetical protein